MYIHSIFICRRVRLKSGWENILIGDWALGGHVYAYKSSIVFCPILTSLSFFLFLHLCYSVRDLFSSWWRWLTALELTLTRVKPYLTWQMSRRPRDTIAFFRTWGKCSSSTGVPRRNILHHKIATWIISWFEWHAAFGHVRFFRVLPSWTFPAKGFKVLPIHVGK